MADVITGPATGTSEVREEKIIPEEILITAHRVLEAFGDGSLGVDILHRDLFDSRKEVVLSSLRALGSIKNPKSSEYILRLLTHRDEDVQCKAVRAIGKTGGEDAQKVLIDLFKTNESEKLRCEILSVLVEAAPHEPEVLTLVRAYAGSYAIQPETRAFSTGLLLKIDDQFKIEDILKEISSKPNSAVLEETIKLAENNPGIVNKIIEHTIDRFYRLPLQNRTLLLSIASPFSAPKSWQILQKSLEDPNPEMRKAAYQIAGTDAQQVRNLDRIVEYLSDRIESTPALEEEAQAAISRMEEQSRQAGIRVTSQLKTKIITRINEVFEEIRKSGRRIGDDTHEIGWLIARSTEYLEYYGDTDLKQAIVHYLKGSSNYSSDELLKWVKNSAIKVEVRHFEGYNSLMGIIKDPKRPGTALIARELSLVKTGKREIMYQLIRNLRLSRLCLCTNEDDLFNEIYTWSKKAKLYRLSEAALLALVKVNARKGTASCIECMKPPVQSKILAITSIRLLKFLSWDIMEPSVIGLLKGTQYPHIILNLIDALSSSSFPPGKDLIKALLGIIISNTDNEILSTVALLLGEKADYTILDGLIKAYPNLEDGKKESILLIIERLVGRNIISKDLGLSEFLYKALRSGSMKIKIRAAHVLYRIEDDYSLKILRDLIKSADSSEKIEAVRGLHGILKPEVLPVLWPLFSEEHKILQETLRDTLLSAGDPETQNKIVEQVLQKKGRAGEDNKYEGPNNTLSLDLSSEKNAYRFEKEHVERCTIIFTDIKDYSGKAQSLTSMELATLIQEYEGILLPLITAHGGELIKRMGDGHLFVFDSSLNAVLAGIRVQKALKRFNSYREGKFRVVIRIGIHTGDVVRKNGDVLGNTVNIASRMESSAKDGSIYISKQVNEEVKQYTHSREIGPVKVKGIEKPVFVFEPFEISLDLPENLDPSKRKVDTAEKKEVPAHRENDKELSQKSTVSQNGKNIIDQKTALFLKQTFAQLNNLCVRVEKGEVEVAAIRKELVRRWHILLNVLKKETADER